MTKFALIAATAVLGFSNAAIASHTPQRSIVVTYSDLDLTKDSGQRSLDRRVERAVQRLCGSTEMAKDMSELEQVEKCRAEAMHKAGPQIARLKPDATVKLAKAD